MGSLRKLRPLFLIMRKGEEREFELAESILVQDALKFASEINLLRLKSGVHGRFEIVVLPENELSILRPIEGKRVIVRCV